MYSFRNDYSEGAHPYIYQLLMENNLIQQEGYGLDVHSKKAEAYIKRELKTDKAFIHFIPGGTQTNLLAVSAFLRPYQCLIACDTGHVNVHETGAIEGTGHKVFTVPHEDGKLTAAGLLKALSYHETEHMVMPSMVYLSNTTELGTVYSKAELSAISRICREHGLLLFLDGARMASALTSPANDLELSDYAKLTDLFYIGGTKNGALFGEALVILREELNKDFRYMIKNKGAMLAKGFVTGIQFEALFEGDLYYKLGRHASQMAQKIEKALKEKGYAFYATPSSNQLFPIVSQSFLLRTQKEFAYNIEKKLDEDTYVIRLVTSWATAPESVDALIEIL